MFLVDGKNVVSVVNLGEHVWDVVVVSEEEGVGGEAVQVEAFRFVGDGDVNDGAEDAVLEGEVGRALEDV